MKELFLTTKQRVAVGMSTLLLGIVSITSTGFAQKERVVRETPPLETVSYVDVERYMGRWFEIASYPQSFQEGCLASEANYRLLNSGKVRVINKCRLNSFDGPEKVARGKAWIVNEETNAELKVQFFWPFRGDYWIIELAEDYSYAVVGHPDRDYLWILSRTRSMEPSVLSGILDRLHRIHYYDLEPLQWTPQPSDEDES